MYEMFQNINSGLPAKLLAISFHPESLSTLHFSKGIHSTYTSNTTSENALSRSSPRRKRHCDVCPCHSCRELKRQRPNRGQGRQGQTQPVPQSGRLVSSTSYW